jgi:hypothetical protein
MEDFTKVDNINASCYEYSYVLYEIGFCFKYL